MTTAAAMIFQIANCLKALRRSTSTAVGTTTTLVDSRMDEPDGWFDGGSIWFLSGDLAGLSAIVTTWDLPTKTFTFPAQALAPGSGIKYAVMEKKYTREDLVQALNMALLALGPFDEVDETLLTVANEDIYTLPVGVSHVKRVQFATSKTEPYTWTNPYPFFSEHDGKLYLDAAHLYGSADYKIRLVWEKQHADVYADADAVTDDVHPLRLAWEAAYHAALMRSGKAEQSDPTTKEMIAIANQMRVEMRRFPVRRIDPTPRQIAW